MSATSLPEVRRATIAVDFSATHEWLRHHRQEYVGNWVVLDGDRLIGYGNDPRPIVAQARAEGVQVPFVEFIRGASEPFMGGWL